MYLPLEINKNILVSIPYTSNNYSNLHLCFYINGVNMLEPFVGISPFHAKHIISNTVELHLSGNWLSGWPIIRISLALRLNIFLL